MTEPAATSPSGRPHVSASADGLALNATLWNLADDDAVTSAADDAFGRASFARHLCNVIDTAPRGASFRIGLFGEWGEGKTSVMAMAEDFLINDGHVCGHITTWSAREPRDVLHALAAELARAVGVSKTASAPVKVTKAVAAKSKNIRELLGQAWPPLKVMNEVIGDALDGLLANAADGAARELLAETYEKMDGRRVVIFVDDLDRVSATSLPTILMALREALPIPGVCLVLGLSLNAIRDALEKSGYGLEEPSRFLEKIIEYPAYLPDIPRARIVSYAVACIRDMDGLRVPEVLEDLGAQLPSNPRRLKRFLRMLSSMRVTLQRFDDSEVSWRTLYLTQLLLCEYPMEARALRADSAALKWLRPRFTALETDGRLAVEDRPSEVSEAKYAPHAPQDKARFLELCNLLRYSHSSETAWTLEQLMMLEVIQPAMTQREARLLTQDVQRDESGSTLAERLRQALEEGEGLSTARAEVLWTYLIGQRQELLHTSYSEPDPDRQAQSVRDMECTTKLLDTLVNELKLFSSGVLGATSLRELTAQASSWSEWRRTDAQRASRAQEMALIEDCLSDAPFELEQASFSELTRLTTSEDSFSPTANETLERLRRRAAVRIASYVRERFTRVEGTKVYVSCHYVDHGKMLLLSPTSVMYDADGMAALSEIAGRAAAGDMTLQLNFFTLVNLFRFSLQGKSTTVSRGDVVDLLKSADVRRLYWHGASSLAMSDSAALDLHHSRVVITEALELDPTELPIPRWWPADTAAKAVEEVARLRHLSEAVGSSATTSEAPHPSSDQR